jgi:hypothetical protein
MRSVSPPVRALGSLAALLLMSACGGGQSSLVQPSQIVPPVQTTLSGDVGGDVTSNTCKGSGGVEVIPCHVKLKPGKQAIVTVSGPGVVDSTETDNCNGLATFTNTHFYGQWQVTAGSTAGKCHAIFTGLNSKGKSVGTARLHVRIL